MKLLDKILRRWRTSVALKMLPQDAASVFDIGCDDGYLLNRLTTVKHRDGCDPRLSPPIAVSIDSLLLQGNFPEVLQQRKDRKKYDAVFALAVFEHFSEEDLDASSHAIASMLSDAGRLIVTVPHPFVDTILDILLFLRLIDGQAVDEHHGLKPEQLVRVLTKKLKLEHSGNFQLGLNKLFVFSKH